MRMMTADGLLFPRGCLRRSVSLLFFSRFSIYAPLSRYDVMTASASNIFAFSFHSSAIWRRF